VYLKYKDYKLVLKGHCDERRTVEYNLALGQKRVDEAAKFLIDLDIEYEGVIDKLIGWHCSGSRVYVKLLFKGGPTSQNTRKT
jgi:hypothetical protein